MVQTDTDPITLFQQWLKEAEAAEVNDPTAMALATATPDGRPSVRMVLLKGVDRQGFTFYTNLESRKGMELENNPQASLCFHWKSLRRQVRVEGSVRKVSDQEADEYFASRPRGSQIGAWASSQSRPLTGRFLLEKRIGEYAARFGLGKVPRPPHWSGFRVAPDYLEFWQDRPFRLHERRVFRWLEDIWQEEQLFP